MTDESRLEKLARRVADGEPVDWEVEEGRSADPDYLQAIRNLKRLAGVAGLQPDPAPEAPGDQPTASYQDDSLPEGRIGPYRLLQKVGEGGMGEVWEAEQEEPVRRRVALKLIKWGMDTKQVVARFESERQALALMDHPGIAKVFDAGATEKGRPYFVMEYVKGVPINRYCDTHRLTTQERLELFRQVCDAVQHAHHKAIIHRDLKPSNVLVTEQDGKRQPKIIDFGIAKATAQKLTEKTLFTELGALIGTPEYMSPEQAELTGEDVDTRTDVYSLGVILYELLVGALPFDPKELRSAGYEGIRKKIREEEPHKPSTRFSTLGDAATESARARQVDPSTLERQLRGDLDWLTMRALEKDRTRRYGSPMELAADIGRYLEDEPVLASPPSAAYRARKFVRRHRVGVVAASIVLLALVVGIAGTTIGLVRATRAEAEARMEATTAEQVSDFLVDLFKVSDPGEARGNSITARELLDQGAERIKDTLADQPEVRAELMKTMGDVYWALGLPQQAVPLHEQALAERKRVLGDDHPDTLWSMNALANAYVAQDRVDKGEPLRLALLEGFKRVHGDDHRATLTAMHNLGTLYRDDGRPDEAEPLLLQAFVGLKQLLGDDQPLTLTSMHSLAHLYQNQGRYEEAEPLYLEAMQAQKRVMGDDHWRTFESMNNLANLYRAQGRYDEAEPLLLESIEGHKRVFGNDHARTLSSMHHLATVYAHQGRHDEAEALLLETIEGRTRVLGSDDSSTLYSMYALAKLYLAQGRYDEARPLALAVNAQTGYEKADYLGTLALAYHHTGATAKAIEIQRKALSLLPDDDTRRAGLERRISEFEKALDQEG